MEQQDYSRTSKVRLFLTQFLIPSPIELVPYFFVSLLVLGIISYQTLLTILADGSPITPLSVPEVFGQRVEYVTNLLNVPFIGRIVLFIFWLGIGSVVYMGVWVFQNLAIEVYDNVATPKLKHPKEESEEGWWGTSLAHTIFFCSSGLLFLFYILVAYNILMPAWTLLFQMGLQTLSELNSLINLLVAIAGTMLTLHILILFWRLFVRVKDFIYNNLY